MASDHTSFCLKPFLKSTFVSITSLHSLYTTLLYTNLQIFKKIEILKAAKWFRKLLYFLWNSGLKNLLQLKVVVVLYYYI